VRTEERNMAEEKLTRAEHLAEIGQLAASLAHEIKNPLAGISGAIQVIRDAMAPDDPQRGIIREILGQIDRLDAAVRDLLIYSRPRPPALVPCDLSAILMRVVSFMRDAPALRRVRVRCITAPDLPRVAADEGQITQLIINLLDNAAHASEEKGAVELRLESDGAEVSLRVRDRGQGMEPAVRDRVFEPFYTTKARGTGLGLPICRKIVEAHGGRIELDSQPGAGTEVTVRLPARVNPGREG
jgi:signal transduction histidine kinase